MNASSTVATGAGWDALRGDLVTDLVTGLVTGLVSGLVSGPVDPWGTSP